MLVWAHGLWGSPNGSKVTAIRESGIDVISPDFNEMELIDRVELLEKTIEIGDMVLAGSCGGGLASALTAQRKPETGWLAASSQGLTEVREHPFQTPPSLLLHPGLYVGLLALVSAYLVFGVFW